MGMASGYLVEDGAGLVLVDAGSPGQERRVLQRMRALDRDDLRLIYITHGHFDHYGSAAALRRLTGAPIAIHRADAEAMARGETPLGEARGRGRLTRYVLPLAEQALGVEATRADILLDDGDGLDGLGVEGRALHLPGHTPGSSALWVGEGLCFVGDLVSTTGRPHAQCLYACDWLALRASLARLAALHPATIYPGHGSRPLPGTALVSLVR